MPDWSGVGKTLILVGGILALLGALLTLFGKMGSGFGWLGRLPGDILISFALSLLLYFLSKR